MKEVKLIGHRFSRGTHDLRDFVTRNRIPARWLDIELNREEVLKLCVDNDVRFDCLPAAILPNGDVVHEPSVGHLAECLGVAHAPACKHYDLMIIGAGPAGLAGAVYAASEGLRTVLVERRATGGQAGQSSRIENYLGFPLGVSGQELSERATDQAHRFGVETLLGCTVEGVEAHGSGRVVGLADGTQVSGSCVLIASGVNYRQMQAPGFEAMTGAGVYYGASVLEAKACVGQQVAVIGAGNSAGQAAVHLAKYAGKARLLIRGGDIRKSMSSYLVDQIEEIPNIEVQTGTVATQAIGSDKLLGLTITPTGDAKPENIPCDACFIFIGAVPETGWLGDGIAVDDHGFVLSGADARQSELWPLDREPYSLETTIPGVFVAGDVRARSMKRVASAVGEGSTAISLVHQYLND